MKMLQNVRLIWLDADINDKDTDFQNTVSYLRGTVNTIDIFTNGAECIQFLKEIQDEKVCIIISEPLSEDIVPCAHDMI